MFSTKFGSASLLAVIIVFLFASNVLGQSEDKKYSHPIVKCDEDNCSFATYAYDENQVPLFLLNHKQSIHNKEISLEEYQTLKGILILNSTDSRVKMATCPFCDDLAVWSDDLEELRMAINLHTKLVHKKELSESEIKAQIK